MRPTPPTPPISKKEEKRRREPADAGLSDCLWWSRAHNLSLHANWDPSIEVTSWRNGLTLGILWTTTSWLW